MSSGEVEKPTNGKVTETDDSGIKEVFDDIIDAYETELDCNNEVLTSNPAEVSIEDQLTFNPPHCTGLDR